MQCLYSIGRLMMLLAVLGLAFAGGTAAHENQESATFSLPAHFFLSPQDASGIKTESCETAHCGSNLLTSSPKSDFLIPRTGCPVTIADCHPDRGINEAAEPPPPRSIIA